MFVTGLSGALILPCYLKKKEKIHVVTVLLFTCKPQIYDDMFVFFILIDNLKGFRRQHGYYHESNS